MKVVQPKLIQKKKTSHEEDIKLVMVAGYHRVSKNLTGRTDCGLLLNHSGTPAWSFAKKTLVTCQDCISGTTFGFSAIEVPPVFPEDGDHHPNDGDDIPILCYECGGLWPCPDSLAKIPVLDMTEFEQSGVV